jgi:hypothetical protein
VSAVVIRTKHGPETFRADEPIVGGQLVEARGSVVINFGDAVGLVGVAAAGSTTVLGVALTDAVPEDDIDLASILAGTPPRPVLNAAPLPPLVPVAHGGMEVPVTYAANADFGVKLIGASMGRVTPAGANPDDRTIVGTCTAEAGVLAGQTGLMRTR